MSIEFIGMLHIFSWISLSALSAIFGYALIRWILNLVWPVRYLTVNHFHNGELVDTSKVDLKSSIPLVKQLKELERRREHGR